MLENNSGDSNIDWKVVVFNKIRNENSNRIPIPFYFEKRIKTGFMVSVYGLFCFVPFRYTPWEYYDNEFWDIVFDKLKTKVFYGLVLKQDDALLTFSLNSRIPQFKKAFFDPNADYSGIVLEVKSNLLKVELGYHFNWECGSIIGTYYKDYNMPERLIKLFSKGDIIVCSYKSKTEKGVLLKKASKFLIKEPEDQISLIGKTVDALVLKTGNIPKVLILNSYTAKIQLTRGAYSNAIFHYFEDEIRKLRKGDTMRCKIQKTDPGSPYYIADWVHPLYEKFEWEFAGNYNLIGEVVLVETTKLRKREYGFVVFGNCKAIFPCTNEIYDEALCNLIYYHLTLKKKNAKLLGKILGLDLENKTFIMKWIHPDIKALK
ncbi:MAG: hypothetical protein WCH34_07395 [Bacteroidota bacterium]